jgi:hypothetical protein
MCRDQAGHKCEEKNSVIAFHGLYAQSVEEYGVAAGRGHGAQCPGTESEAASE